MVVAFRKHTVLPLDDCLYALQATIPHLTRSSLHRCLQRHGISRLPEVAGDKPAKQPFKVYPIGCFHITSPRSALRRASSTSLWLWTAPRVCFRPADAEGDGCHRQGFPQRPGQGCPLQNPHRAYGQRHPIRRPTQEPIGSNCDVARPSLSTGPAGRMASNIVSPNPNHPWTNVMSRG